MLVRRLLLACFAASTLSSAAFAALNGRGLQPAAVREPVNVGLIELSGKLQSGPGPLDWMFPSDSVQLPRLTSAIRNASDESGVDGLVIRLKDAQLSTSDVEELGAAIKQCRESGVKVHVFGESFSTADLLLGSYADEIICQSGGAIEFPGLSMEEMYLADTFAWAGLKADMVQVGDFKGANEEMVNGKPSEAWNTNIDSLLDSLYGNIRATMKAGRKMTDARLDAALERAWMTNAEEAVELGLIDSAIDLPTLTEHLAKSYGASVVWDDEIVSEPESQLGDMSNPFALLQALSREPNVETTGATIAVLHIEGEIVDGDSSGGGIFGGGSSVGSRDVRNAIEDILADDNIKAVLVRIDSPGGSATASEVMWQGLSRLAASKPVWASVGGMAASGGYYVASAVDKVYVNPSSIVGSIGVVGGKISPEGLFKKFHINVVSRGRGPRATLFDSHAWTADETAIVREKMNRTYEQFTARVAAGRKGIDLAETAEGRLFTGADAIGLKMADRVGTMDDAIEALATFVDIDDFDVVDYPGSKSIMEVAHDTFGSIQSPELASQSFGPIGPAMRALLGDRAWDQIRTQLSAFSQLRTARVILVAPRAIIFR